MKMVDSKQGVEPIYKEYRYPNGKVLQLTKSEFDRVADVFRSLLKQDQKMRQEGKGHLLKELDENNLPEICP